MLDNAKKRKKKKNWRKIYVHTRIKKTKTKISLLCRDKRIRMCIDMVWVIKIKQKIHWHRGRQKLINNIDNWKSTFNFSGSFFFLFNNLYFCSSDFSFLCARNKIFCDVWNIVYCDSFWIIISRKQKNKNTLDLFLLLRETHKKKQLDFFRLE